VEGDNSNNNNIFVGEIEKETYLMRYRLRGASMTLDEFYNYLEEENKRGELNEGIAHTIMKYLNNNFEFKKGREEENDENNNNNNMVEHKKKGGKLNKKIYATEEINEFVRKLVTHASPLMRLIGLKVLHVCSLFYFFIFFFFGYIFFFYVYYGIYLLLFICLLFLDPQC
jgi:hypothetical protein